MIVVFASSYDSSAATLVARWAADNASLLTCDDLSRVGWRHHLSCSRDSTAVISARIVSQHEITGVLIRWPGVFPQELIQIAPSDRDYVAGEMMAFLVSWLSSLSCPVVNRPTPMNLTGPAWRQEQWTYAAAQLGIPVRPVHRHVLKGAPNDHVDLLPPDVATVTVVGERCFGMVDELLVSQARSLAQTAGVSLLAVTFSGPSAGSCFVGADLLPAMSDQVADAVLDILRSGVTPISINAGR